MSSGSKSVSFWSVITRVFIRRQKSERVEGDILQDSKARSRPLAEEYRWFLETKKFEEIEFPLEPPERI